jgi:hypothetical protein
LPKQPFHRFFPQYRPETTPEAQGESFRKQANLKPIRRDTDSPTLLSTPFEIEPDAASVEKRII